MKKIIALAIVAVFLIQCSTVPITGRKRLNFVSDAEVLPASFAQYKGFLAENKLSKDASKSAQIKKVGKNISAAVDKFMRANGMKTEADSYKWEFNLVEDKTVNAWCMPGGKVVFYTGIMPICDNVNGVAAVMGGGEHQYMFSEISTDRYKNLRGFKIRSLNDECDLTIIDVCGNALYCPQPLNCKTYECDN